MVYKIRLKVCVRFDEMESVLCDWLSVVGIFSVHSGVPLYLHDSEGTMVLIAYLSLHQRLSVEGDRKKQM